MSNIVKTETGLIEKSTGRKIVSPLDQCSVLCLDHGCLDEKIKQLIYPRRKQYPYSTDRRYASIIVDEIGKQSTEIVDRFNHFIETKWKAVCDTFKVESIDAPSWNTFILWATPEIICQAAIYSVSQCTSKRMN